MPQLIISRAQIDTGIQTEQQIETYTQEYEFTNITLLFKQLDDLKNQSQQLIVGPNDKENDEQLEILTKELQIIPQPDQKNELEQIRSEHQKLEAQHQQLVEIHKQMMDQDLQLQQKILSITFQPAL
ncbi:hypothetical protein pb186bvf_000972 [Paramecium bursaria]